MLGALLGLIPGLSGVVQGITTAYFDQKVRLYQAKTGATRDVAVAAIQGTTAVAQRWWFVAILYPLGALPCLAYLYKTIMWDVIIMGGTTETDPLKGMIGWAFYTIIGSIYVHAIVDTVVKEIKS